jgi:hypothetical protein
MAVFFTKLEVRPTDQNAQAELVEGAYAHCWVLEDSPTAAYNTASYYVRRGEWNIVDATAPVEVVEEDFANADLGLQQLTKAKKERIAIFYTAWSRDGKTSSGPTTLRRSGIFDLNTYVQSQKRLTNKARCLHFESKGECKDLSKAHSSKEWAFADHIARLPRLCALDEHWHDAQECGQSYFGKERHRQGFYVRRVLCSARF